MEKTFLICPDCGAREGHVWADGADLEGEMTRRGLEPERTSRDWFRCPNGHLHPFLWWHAADPFDIRCNHFFAGSGEPVVQKTTGVAELEFPSHLSNSAQILKAGNKVAKIDPARFDIH